MNVKNSPEATVLIGKRLHEIIDSCLEIDVADPSKRQRTSQQEQADQLKQ